MCEEHRIIQEDARWLFVRSPGQSQVQWTFLSAVKDVMTVEDCSLTECAPSLGLERDEMCSDQHSPAWSNLRFLSEEPQTAHDRRERVF